MPPYAQGISATRGTGYKCHPRLQLLDGVGEVVVLEELVAHAEDHRGAHVEQEVEGPLLVRGRARVRVRARVRAWARLRAEGRDRAEARARGLVL